MAAHRKLDRRRVYLCAGGLRKRARFSLVMFPVFQKLAVFEVYRVSNRIEIQHAAKADDVVSVKINHIVSKICRKGSDSGVAEMRFTDIRCAEHDNEITIGPVLP